MKKSTTFTMTLGWALSWAIGWFIGWSVVRDIGLGMSYTMGGPIGGFIGGALAGVLGAFIYIVQLRKTLASIRWYHIIIFCSLWSVIHAFDWSRGFVVAALGGQEINTSTSGPMIGLLGGLVTALILRWSNSSLKLNHMALICLGWTIGFAIGGIATWAIGFNSALDYVYGPMYGNDPGITALLFGAIIAAVGGGFSGLTGSLITSWQITQAQEKTS